MSKKKKAAVAAGFGRPRSLPTPKRTTVAVDEGDRFVDGGSQKATRGKRKKAGERLTIYVPPELAEEVRVRCAKERRSLSDAGTEALSMWISSFVNKSTSE